MMRCHFESLKNFSWWRNLSLWIGPFTSIKVLLQQMAESIWIKIWMSLTWTQWPFHAPPSLFTYLLSRKISPENSRGRVRTTKTAAVTMNRAGQHGYGISFNTVFKILKDLNNVTKWSLSKAGSQKAEMIVRLKHVSPLYSFLLWDFYQNSYTWG